MKQVIRVLRANPLLVTALVAITLVCFVHPALGLFILLFFHALCCHNALCGYVSEFDPPFLTILMVSLEYSQII